MSEEKQHHNTRSEERRHTTTHSEDKRNGSAGGHPRLGSPSRMFPDEINDISPARRKSMYTFWDATIQAFKVVMCVGLVVGLLFFLRPTVSVQEKRNLTPFPAITWDSFWDGSFTSQVSTWYADTFPFREQLIAIDNSLEGLFGIQPSVQQVGAKQKADDIPDEAAQPDTTESQDQQPAKLPEEFSASDLENDIQGQILNGAYVKDGACYSTYYFTQEAANAYAKAVNKAASDLGDSGKVYSILIPINSGVLLSEDEQNAMGGSNQEQAINYYYSLFDKNVATVPTTATLKEHNSEYLYFRTDHHWTALGAYYVYRNLCEVKGLDPHDLSQFTETDFAPFTGSYYDTLQVAAMTENPDTIQTWTPMGTNDMTYTDTDGGVIDWKVIQDVSGWDDGGKYNTFVGGDEPWAEIHNPNITDGSSCIVVKESYGNAFIPWLVDHYQTVYIADYRYTTVNVVDFMKENNVNDLIMINSIQIAGSVQTAQKIESLV